MCMLSRINGKSKLHSTFFFLSSLMSFYLAYTINNYEFIYSSIYISIYLFIQILENVIVILMILLSLTVIYYFVYMYIYISFFSLLFFSISFFEYKVTHRTSLPIVDGRIIWWYNEMKKNHSAPLHLLVSSFSLNQPKKKKGR